MRAYRFSMSWPQLISTFSLLLLLTGCGGGSSDQPDLGTVEGKVTLDGQPLSDATVSFIPEEGRTSTAVTDAEGHYELNYTLTTPGAKIGQHAVTITTFKAAADPDAGDEDTPEKVPAKYNKATELKKEVTAGKNVIDFELTSN